MGLETGTYISDLNASNPVGASDQVAQSDDHLRLIKSVLLNSLPGITGAVTSTHTELNYLDGVTGVTGTGNLALSAGPTFTGTLNAAAIAATSYDGIAAANLVDKTATENISGAWGFNDITVNSIEGISGTNLVDKATAETITGTWTFSVVGMGELQGVGGPGQINTTSSFFLTSNADAKEPGYKGAPQRTVGSSDSLVLADCGKMIYLNAGSGQTLTIPANASVAFPIGTIIPIINDSGNDWTIAITTDTLEEYGGTTGSKTLPDNNKAVLEKVTATLWKYSSTG